MRRCRCGAPRRPGELLCRNCYFALPAILRARLWSAELGAIFEATRWLKEHAS